MATCNTATLFASAKCFTCLTPREFWPIKLALLCKIAQQVNAGVDCSVSGLFARGKCFTCLSTREYWILKLQLLCQILSASGGGGGGVIPSTPTNLDVANNSSNGATILTWSQATAPANNAVERSINGGAYVEVSVSSGNLTTFTDSQILNNGDIYRYRVRGINGTNFGAYSNTAAVGDNINYNGTADVTISIPDLIEVYGNFTFISEPNLTTLSFPLLRNVTGTLDSHGNTLLTSINWSSLRQVGGTLRMTDANVTSLSLNNLIGVTGSINFSSSGLTSITMPALLTIGGDFLFNGTAFMGAVSCALLNIISGSLNMSSSAITSFSMPFLTTLGSTPGTFGDFTAVQLTNLTNLTAGFLQSIFGVLNVSFSNNLATMSFGNLLSVGKQVNFTNCGSLSSVTLNALQTIGLHGSGGLTFSSCSSLTTLDLSALTSLSGFNFACNSNTALATLLLPAWVPTDNGMITNFSGCALNAAAVNQILARGVARCTRTDSYLLQGGTNSAPTGQGITDKATLTSGACSGNTVNTN